MHTGETERDLLLGWMKNTERKLKKIAMMFNVTAAGPGGGGALPIWSDMCLLQLKSRGLSDKMCTLQNMGSFSKNLAIPYQV